jgi:hypothetical protein
MCCLCVGALVYVAQERGPVARAVVTEPVIPLPSSSTE